MKHAEPVLDHEPKEGRKSPVRARRDPPLESKSCNRNGDSVCQLGLHSSPRRSDSPFIVIEDTSSPPQLSPHARIGMPNANLLVCAKCTFANRSSLSDQEETPLPRVCAVCDHPMSAIPTSGGPRTERPRFAEDPSSRPNSPAHITAADYSTSTEEADGGPPGALLVAECPTCTFVIPNVARATHCPLCTAPLIGATSTLQTQPSLLRRCGACTLYNDVGATVCSACETPLACAGNVYDDMGEVQGHGMRVPIRENTVLCELGREGHEEGSVHRSMGTAITTAAELKSRTAEERGDKGVFTEGLIPRLHERLLDQCKTRKRRRLAGGRGSGRWAAAARGSTARSSSGSGRGALSWIVSDGDGVPRGQAVAGRDEHQAEWRLCHPATAHCSQRGAPGSRFSCGYRNIQMLCSALMEWPEYRKVLFGGSGCIPGIALLQGWIERAWADGYDPDGCEQLGGPGALLGSEIWIGATECATLLRSFGVKAEVVDFETDSSFRARSRRGNITREDHRSEPNISRDSNKRKSSSSIGSTELIHAKAASPDSSRSSKQQSLLAYMSQQRALPTGQALGMGSSGEGSGECEAIDTVLNKSALATAAGPGKDDGSSVGIPGEGECENNGSCGNEAQIAASDVTPSYNNGPTRPETTLRDKDSCIPSYCLTGGRENGSLTRPLSNAPVIQCGRGGRSGQTGKGTGRGARGRGNGRGRGKVQDITLGTGCGQAVAEWAWTYFRAPWGADHWPPSTSTSQTAPGHQREKKETSSVQTMASPPREGSWAGQETEGERVCLDDRSRLHPTDAAGGPSPAHTDTGGNRNDHGKIGCRRAEAAESDVPKHASTRRPPPLYLQHDGHSRTIVGAIWSGGRGSGGRGGVGGGARGQRVGGAGSDGAIREPGTLLVFDPSHQGKEIDDALANEQNLNWCRFLKRGVHSLRHRQLQMVAVRPGLVEPGQADSWKKIVSTKIRVS